jgi:hypothetical protein
MLQIKNTKEDNVNGTTISKPKPKSTAVSKYATMG